MAERPAPRSMRVLAIHRYFWPDTPPYASMLRSIAARWAADGHKVDVLSTQPSYKPNAGIPRQPGEEVVDGVTVRRLDLPAEHGRPLVRLRNIVHFGRAIVRQPRRTGPYDLIMASTAPPVLIGAAARVAAQLAGARFLYHCMDIHPEIGRLSGDFRNPLVFSLLRRIDASSCKAAARVIVLSRDMENAVRARPNSANARVHVVNNFNLPSFPDQAITPTISDEMRKTPGTFRLLFAGNIGRFQGLEAVIDAMRRLESRPEIELVFLGEGRALGAMKSRAGSLLGNQIKFFPHQSVDVARQVIRSADLCLITLAPGIIRYAYPSKTMTYLGEGRPLLVAVEAESALSEMVTLRRVGMAVEPNDPDSLASAVVELVEDPVKYREIAASAARIGAELFSQEEVLNEWSKLMTELSVEVA